MNIGLSDLCKKMYCKGYQWVSLREKGDTYTMPGQPTIEEFHVVQSKYGEGVSWSLKPDGMWFSEIKFVLDDDDSGGRYLPAWYCKLEDENDSEFLGKYELGDVVFADFNNCFHLDTAEQWKKFLFCADRTGHHELMFPGPFKDLYHAGVDWYLVTAYAARQGAIYANDKDAPHMYSVQSGDSVVQKKIDIGLDVPSVVVLDSKAVSVSQVFEHDGDAFHYTDRNVDSIQRKFDGNPPHGGVCTVQSNHSWTCLHRLLTLIDG